MCAASLTAVWEVGEEDISIEFLETYHPTSHTYDGLLLSLQTTGTVSVQLQRTRK